MGEMIKIVAVMLPGSLQVKSYITEYVINGGF